MLRALLFVALGLAAAAGQQTNSCGAFTVAAIARSSFCGAQISFNASDSADQCAVVVAQAVSASEVARLTDALVSHVQYMGASAPTASELEDQARNMLQGLLPAFSLRSWEPVAFVSVCDNRTPAAAPCIVPDLPYNYALASKYATDQPLPPAVQTLTVPAPAFQPANLTLDASFPLGAAASLAVMFDAPPPFEPADNTLLY